MMYMESSIVHPKFALNLNKGLLSKVIRFFLYLFRKPHVGFRLQKSVAKNREAYEQEAGVNNLFASCLSNEDWKI